MHSTTERGLEMRIRWDLHATDLSCILNELLGDIFREELYSKLEMKRSIFAFLGNIMCHNLHIVTHISKQFLHVHQDQTTTRREYSSLVQYAGIDSKPTHTFLFSFNQVRYPSLSAYCRPKYHTSLKPMVFTTCGIVK